MIVASVGAVMGVAVWAYQENYRTQAAAREAAALSAEIGALRDRLALLEAEWAWLNRPERLTALVLSHAGELELLPFAPEHFGRIDLVAFPPEPVPEAGMAAVIDAALAQSDAGGEARR
jgi:hypothetical protein